MLVGGRQKGNDSQREVYRKKILECDEKLVCHQ